MLSPDVSRVACHEQVWKDWTRRELFSFLRSGPLFELSHSHNPPTLDEWDSVINRHGLSELRARHMLCTEMLKFTEEETIKALGPPTKSPYAELFNCMRPHFRLASNLADPVSSDALHTLATHWMETMVDSLPLVNLSRGEGGLPIIDVIENNRPILHLGGLDGGSWKSAEKDAAKWLGQISESIHTPFKDDAWRIKSEGIVQLMSAKLVLEMFQSILNAVHDLGSIESEESAVLPEKFQQDDAIRGFMWSCGSSYFVAPKSHAARMIEQTFRQWIANKSAIDDYVAQTMIDVAPETTSSVLSDMAAAGIWFSIVPAEARSGLLKQHCVDGSACLPWTPPERLGPKVSREVVIFVDPRWKHINNPGLQSVSANDWARLFSVPPDKSLTALLSRCTDELLCAKRQSTVPQLGIFEHIGHITCPPSSVLIASSTFPSSAPVALASVPGQKMRAMWVRHSAHTGRCVISNPAPAWIIYYPHSTGERTMKVQHWIFATLGIVPASGDAVRAFKVHLNEDNPQFESLGSTPGILGFYPLPPTAPEIVLATEVCDSRDREPQSVALTLRSIVPMAPFKDELSRVLCVPGSSSKPTVFPGMWISSVGTVPLPIVTAGANIWHTIFAPVKWPTDVGKSVDGTMGIAERRMLTLLNRRFQGEPYRFIWDLKSKLRPADWNALRTKNSLRPLAAGAPATVFEAFRVSECIKERCAEYQRVAEWRRVEGIDEKFLTSLNWRSFARGVTVPIHGVVAIAVKPKNNDVCVIFCEMGISTSESLSPLIVSFDAPTSTSIPISESLDVVLEERKKPHPTVVAQTVVAHQAPPSVIDISWKPNDDYVATFSISQIWNSKDFVQEVSKKKDYVLDPLFVIFKHHTLSE